MRQIKNIMPKIGFLFTMLFCACFGLKHAVAAELTADLGSGQPLKMIGVGMHQELRNDIYIGALFAPESVTDVDQLFDDGVAKRMSIRFVSKYSNRNMSRHWKERLGMNNPRDQWEPLTREIVGFSRLFKQNLIAGDEVNIDHISGKGTLIYLNGTLFETIEKPEFIKLLLNVWLGTNPPTKAFKNNIRGQGDAADIQKYSDQFAAIQPVTGRFDNDLKPVRVASASNPPGSPQSRSQQPGSQQSSQQPAKSTNNRSPSKPETNVAATNKTAENQALSSRAAQQQAKTTPQNTNQQNSATTESGLIADAAPRQSAPPKNDNKAATESSKNKADIDKIASLVTESTQPKIELSPDFIAKSTTKDDIRQDQSASMADLNATTDSEGAAIEEDFFDADLVLGAYTRDLINAIRQHQQYPRKALINGDQGSVAAKVTIDASGELITVDIVERSGSRVLDNAVLRMVKRASPFEAIPEKLNMQSFEFDLPITFQL